MRSKEIRRSKLIILRHQYENFTMKENESIQSMIPRLQTLLNNLRSFRTVYCNDDVNDKILRTPKWRTQGSTLRAFKDLEKMFLEELVGILIIQY